MSQVTLNPFRPTRWEHHTDGRPLIWFTETAEMLAAEKSAYMYGSRGSGKTTLLKGICWEELCYNESLRIQRNLSDFSNIGIYIRFPDHIAESMSFTNWGSIFPNVINPDYEFYRFFTAVVEMVCLERTLEACNELRVIGAVVTSPSSEIAVVEDFLAEFSKLRAFSDGPAVTFLDLARLLRGAIGKMNEACGRGTMATLVENLPAREPYQLLSYLTERLAATIRVKAKQNGHRVGFKYCLDDCEVLSQVQRKSINSLVRLSRAPCSWVVSSVGGALDDSETFISSQPLTDADRKVISLDERDSKDFRQLCQSVVSLRLLFSMPENERPALSEEKIAGFFDLSRRLGHRDVNDMMAILVRRSGKPLAKRLRAAAQSLESLLAKRHRRVPGRQPSADGKLPLYETYILLLWRGREDSFRTSFDSGDVDNLVTFVDSFGQPGFDAWIRRKQRAAFLHFASVLGTRRLPFAGDNIVISLSDGSIRDFLEIMGEIYEVYVRERRWDPKDPSNLSKFSISGSIIYPPTQMAGIYAASSAYFEGITHRSEIDTDVIARLIGGIGHYTSLLQTTANDPRVLGSAERGIFFIDYSSVMNPSGLSDEGRLVHSAVRQAELAGYIRPVEFTRYRASSSESQVRSVAFRLHRRFSPHFRFSYRGAYEGVVLDPRDLARLCIGGAGVTARSWAEGLAAHGPARATPQFVLPLHEAPLDD